MLNGDGLKMKRIELLDCTLRDGGLALKENFSEGRGREGYTEEATINIVNALKKTGVDIIELGSVQNIDRSYPEFAIYSNIKEVSNLALQGDSSYAVFFQGPDIPINRVPEWQKGMCDWIRFSVRYSEIKRSLSYCEELVKRGYKVSVQPIVTMRYTDDELKYVAEETERINANAIYFVDSYGYMTGQDVDRIFKILNSILDKEKKIGFHAHNNMDSAFTNSIEFIGLEKDRDIIVDACCMGMGQGAGNLKTEVIAAYLNQWYGKEYDMLNIFEICDYIDSMHKDNIWGYSVAAFIAAYYRTAYKYALLLRRQWGYSYVKIAEGLAVLPDEYRHRFMQEGIEHILNNK